MGRELSHRPILGERDLLNGGGGLWMEKSRAFRRGSAARFSAVTKLTYRAELARRDALGKTSRYYDGGEFSPYNVESLLDLLRGESRVPHTTLDLTLELHGHCPDAVLRDLVQRFAELEAPKAQVRICTPGHRPVVVGCGSVVHATGSAARGGKSA